MIFKDKLNFRDGLATLVILLTFALVIVCLFKINDKNRDLVMLIVGDIFGMATTILGFYFVSNYKKPNQTTTVTTKDITPKKED